MASNGGALIAITGPAAVGKSTIARALQAELGRDGALWLVIELDGFARALSREWIAVHERRGRFADAGFSYTRADDGAIGLTLGADARRVLAAFHRSVAAVVTSGVGVVCETIVYDEQDWADWTEAVRGIPTRWVKLAAPLDILEARERADRSRVFQGLARGMSVRHRVGVYDLEADTSVEDVPAIVGRILSLRV